MNKKLKEMKINKIFNLNPLWVTGFSDGESSFSVSVTHNKAYKTGYVFIPSFAIELKDKDLDLLYKIQGFFQGVGKVYKIENKGHAVYAVTKISDLNNIIIPHFIKYPLLTIKRINFLLFKEIIDLMYKKSHLTLGGAQSVINIRASMNKGATRNFLENFPYTVPVGLPYINPLSVKDISVDWLIGFTDAEGCFFINVRLNRKKTGYWVSPAFILAQHSRDTTLFYLIKEFLSGGSVIKETTKPVVRYRSDNLSLILEVIIPLFDKNPLQSRKLKDYLSFCLVCQLMKNKAHLTEEGLASILEIKNNMNSKRKD